MSKTIVLLFFSWLLATSSYATLTVTAVSDKESVRIGDRVIITVHAKRTDPATDPSPSHAALHLGPEWEAGSQSADSERMDSTGITKTWRFELIAISETLATITPVVILGVPPADAPPLATNRILGSPITVTIHPPKQRPWWLPHPITVAALFGVATAAFTIVRVIRRRRQNRPRPVLTPLMEALAMMEDVHASCREDRAGRFFADVERVLTGYLSRRMGRPLGSATASEIAVLASRHVADSGTIHDLQAILSRCTTARFSGAKVDFQTLVETETLTMSVLERLDAVWVTDTSPEETSGDATRT